MPLHKTSFLYFIFSKNKNYVVAAASAGIIYFIILRYLYPIPSFYADSFAWISAAKTLQPVSMRPIGYSKLIFFFSLFSSSDIALIAAQYLSNLLANLFLFFTCLWFFNIQKVHKILLFVLLVLNPFYLFYSNYVTSDAFFSCFTVLWFTLLMWILQRPSWWLFTIHLAVLAGVFILRYNAVIFPFITAVAILLSSHLRWKKGLYIFLSFFTIFLIVSYITKETKEYAGTKTFSAFSGWQLANDALHIVPFAKIDTAAVKDKEVKDFLTYTLHFFDTTRQTFPDSVASAVYMWHINSPLKNYMNVYPGRKKLYFATWNALGPVYSKVGQTLILQKPTTYLKHFVLPNAKAYLFPGLEMYESYMEKNDTVAAIAQRFYHYKSNKASQDHPIVYALIFEPARYFFTVINLLFPVFALYFFFSKKYRQQSLLYNQTLLCYSALYIGNLIFIVLLAPSVLRYHVFIFTLALPILAAGISKKSVQG